MEMNTKVEMVTCGEDGLATNEGEVLLHGELWRSGDREILINWKKKRKEREKERKIKFAS